MNICYKTTLTGQRHSEDNVNKQDEQIDMFEDRRMLVKCSLMDFVRQFGNRTLGSFAIGVIALATIASAQHPEAPHRVTQTILPSAAPSTQNSNSANRQDKSKISSPASKASAQDQGQPDSPNPQSKTLVPVTETPKDQMISEINAIRNQLGGGIAEHLHEIFQDRMPVPFSAEHLQTEFDNELRKLNQLQASSQTLAKPVVLDAPTQMNRHRFLSVVSDQVTATSAYLDPGPLRRAARHLESASAELETVGDYAEADKLREKAKSFWLKARQPGTAVPVQAIRN